MRNPTISIAKAIAIVLMVAGHSWVGSSLEQYVGIFHMPVFWFASGYCFKDKHLENFWRFLKKKLSGLYWPYIKWGLLFLALHNILIKLYLIDGQTYTWLDLRILALYVLRMRHEEQLLGGFWFLQCLFWGLILFWTARKFIKNKWITTILFLFGAILFNYKNWHLTTFCIYDQDLWAAFFINIGYIAANRKKRSWNVLSHKKRLSLVIVLLIFTLLWICLKLDFVHLSYCIYNPILATGGITGIILLSKQLSYTCFCKILTYLGNKTLTILTWHFMSFKVLSFIFIITSTLGIVHLKEFPTINSLSDNWFWIIYLFFGILFPIILATILETFKSKVQQAITKHCSTEQ